MANYYTHFSFELEKVTPEEAEWFETKYQEMELDEDREQNMFGMRIEGAEACKVWFHDDGGESDESALAEFISQFLEKFRPKEIVVFQIAFTASRPLLDAFGGAAYAVSAKSIQCRDTNSVMHELQRKLELEIAND